MPSWELFMVQEIIYEQDRQKIMSIKSILHSLRLFRRENFVTNNGHVLKIIPEQ
jgi:hypothetical protein